MSKQAKHSKKAAKRKTNWMVIGGVIIGGIVLVGLMALAFREPGRLKLQQFCNQNPENCMVEGDEDAPVTIVEVSDYGCGHCRDFNLEKSDQIKEQFVETGQVRWVVMPFALSGQGGVAPTLPTAVAAMCANEQDQFAEFHKAAFLLQGTELFNTEEGINATAASLGLDLEAFASCLADNDYERIIRRNMQAAASAGLEGTPSFAIGEELISGNQPLEVFQQRIESLLQ